MPHAAFPPTPVAPFGAPIASSVCGTAVAVWHRGGGHCFSTATKTAAAALCLLRRRPPAAAPSFSFFLWRNWHHAIAAMDASAAMQQARNLLAACQTETPGAGAAAAAALKGALVAAQPKRAAASAASASAAPSPPADFPLTLPLLTTLTLAACYLPPGYREEDVGMAAARLLQEIVEAPHVSAQLEAVLSKW